MKGCPENVEPMPPDEIAEILEIRKRKDDEVRAIYKRNMRPDPEPKSENFDLASLLVELKGTTVSSP